MFEYYKNNNKKNSNINKIYSQHLYTGLIGVMMKYCHRMLEVSFPSNNNKRTKILEIGSGSEPHYKYLKSTNCEYYILEKNKPNKKIKEKTYKNSKIKYFYYDGTKIKFRKNYFDRIVISHTLEHIPSPEKFLKLLYEVVKKGGVISISLPTDPGILWRLGRLYNKIFNIKKNLNLNALEYDYMNSIEHINSIYNLINIIRYNFRTNKKIENFLPFKIKIADCNLFYNVHIIK